MVLLSFAEDKRLPFVDYVLEDVLKIREPIGEPLLADGSLAFGVVVLVKPADCVFASVETLIPLDEVIGA